MEVAAADAVPTELSRLCREADVVAAAVVDIAPDFGARLRLEVELNLDPTGHPIAHAMLSETVTNRPAGVVMGIFSRRGRKPCWPARPPGG